MMHLLISPAKLNVSEHHLTGYNLLILVPLSSSFLLNLTVCIMRGACNGVGTGKQGCYDPRTSYLCAVGGQLPSFLLAWVLVSYQGEAVAWNQIIFIPSAPIGKAHVSCQLRFSIQPLRSCTSFQIIVMFCTFPCSCEIRCFCISLGVLKNTW